MEDAECLDEDEEYGDDDGGPLDNDEMYGLRVSSAGGGLLLRRRGDSAPVSVGQRIRVRTHFETTLSTSFFHVALEKCWIADHKGASQPQVKLSTMIHSRCKLQMDLKDTKDNSKLALTREPE